MADTRIDDLRRRLERDPGSRIFAQLAEELRKSGDLGEAIGVARAGLAVHPSYPSARLTLGRALLDSGDATSARVELESALRDAPDNILASRYLAQAREQLGDLKGAAEQYRKTLVMAPDDRQLQGALAALESRLSAPAAGAASAPETTPPVVRAAPPPLPPRAAARGEVAVTPGSGTSSIGPVDTAGAPGAGRAGAPPLVFAPSRPAVAPAPEPLGDTSTESGALSPTVRIHAPQTDAVPPPPPPPPAPPAPPPPPLAATQAVTAQPPAEAPSVDGPEPRTLPGTPVTAPAAEAATAPPAAESPAESASTTPFSSSTLAELYFQQGLVDRAAEVYRQVLEQDPDNDKARQRLAELERTPPASEERAARRRALERTIAGLETLLGAVRRR